MFTYSTDMNMSEIIGAELVRWVRTRLNSDMLIKTVCKFLGV